MGGLVSALEAQNGAGRINGALATCGIAAGAINLNNYRLDGEYTIAHLLAPGLGLGGAAFTGYQPGPLSGVNRPASHLSSERSSPQAAALTPRN